MKLLRYLILLLLFSNICRAEGGLVDPADYNNIKIKFKTGKSVKFEIDSTDMLSKNLKTSDVREILERCQQIYPLKAIDSDSYITIFFRNNTDSITQSSQFTSNLKEDSAFIACVEKRVENLIRKTNCDKGAEEVIVLPPGDYTHFRTNFANPPEGSEIFCNEDQLLKSKPDLLKKSK